MMGETLRTDIKVTKHKASNEEFSCLPSRTGPVHNPTDLPPYKYYTATFDSFQLHAGTQNTGYSHSATLP